MSDLNVIVLSGRCCEKVKFGYTTNTQLAKLEFSIACNRSVKKGEEWENEANFFNITIFGKRAESLQKQITKGRQVTVKGRLVQSKWEKDGQTYSRIIISADEVFLTWDKKDSKDEKTFTANEKQVIESFENTFGANEEFPEDVPF